MVGRADVVLLKAGGLQGTGFLVTPELLVTALHVVARFDNHARAVLDEKGRPIPLGPVRCTYYAETLGTWDEEINFDPVNDPYDALADCAVLRVGMSEGARVWRCERARLDERGAECRAYGFPATHHQEGTPYHGTLSGLRDPRSVETTASSEQVPMHRAWFHEAGGLAAQTPRGFSGAPVVVGERVVGIVRRFVQGGGDRAVGGTVELTPIEAVLALVGISDPENRERPNGSDPNGASVLPPTTSTPHEEEPPAHTGDLINTTAFLFGLGLFLCVAALWVAYKIFQIQTTHQLPSTDTHMLLGEGEGQESTVCHIEIRVDDGNTLVPEKIYLEISQGAIVIDTRRELTYECPREPADVKLWISAEDGALYVFEWKSVPNGGNEIQLNLTDGIKFERNIPAPIFSACPGRFVCVDQSESGCKQVACERESCNDGTSCMQLFFICSGLYHCSEWSGALCVSGTCTSD